MVKGTSPPKYAVPKEGVPRAVDYVDPVLNKAPAGGRLAADDHIANEPRDPREVEHEELMDRIRRDKARTLADQAAIRALALRMGKGCYSSDDEEMPGLDPDSDDEEENNSYESDADEKSDGEDESSGQEEEENIPDLQPEDDESPADEIAKALKAYLDHSEEGELRYTSSDVSIVQAGDPRDPSMYQLQRRINGKEGGYRYIRAAPDSSRSRKAWRRGRR